MGCLIFFILKYDFLSLLISLIQGESDMMRFIKSEEGTSMTEYALLLGLITIAIVSVITAFGTKLPGAFTKVTDVIPN